MNRIAACVAAALLLGGCAGGSGGRFVDDDYGYEPSRSGIEDGRQLEISRIGTYTNSEIGEPRRLIIRSETEWRNFWDDLNLGERPEVDFDDEMVIAVSSGTRPTTGYSIRVAGVTAGDDGRLVVDVVETEPARNCITGQQITRPVDVVVVPRVDLRTWSFTERGDVMQC